MSNRRFTMRSLFVAITVVCLLSWLGRFGPVFALLGVVAVGALIGTAVAFKRSRTNNFFVTVLGGAAGGSLLAGVPLTILFIVGWLISAGAPAGQPHLFVAHIVAWCLAVAASAAIGGYLGLAGWIYLRAVQVSRERNRRNDNTCVQQCTNQSSQS